MYFDPINNPSSFKNSIKIILFPLLNQVTNNNNWNYACVIDRVVCGSRLLLKYR